MIKATHDKSILIRWTPARLSWMILLGALASCDQPFEPKAPFQEDLVVYAIVSDGSDAQFARVFKTYDPPAFDPFVQTVPTDIAGAQVTITDGATVTAYRDTQVVRQDSSRYPAALNAYIASPLRGVKGSRYALSVLTSDGLSASSSIQLPEAGRITVSNISALLSPGVTTHTSLFLAAFTAPQAKGFLLRFFLRFESLEGGVWVPRMREIPLAIFQREEGEERLFPVLTRSSSDGTKSGVSAQSFDMTAYRTIIGEIYRDYSMIRFTSALFVLIQVEQNLYNYVGIANGFRDPATIRLDEPDFTNIFGGVGVLGGFVHDSLAVTLPQFL